MSEDQRHNPDEGTPVPAGSARADNPSAAPDETESLLFDGEDTDTGEPAPAGDELDEEELTAIRESQADPETEPEDAEVG